MKINQITFFKMIEPIKFISPFFHSTMYTRMTHVGAFKLCQFRHGGSINVEIKKSNLVLNPCEIYYIVRPSHFVDMFIA